MKPKYYAPLDMKIGLKKKGEFCLVSKAQEQVTTLESVNAKIILPILSFNGTVHEETEDIGAFLPGLGDDHGV